MGDFSRILNRRILHKGPEIGYCVICGKYGKLSRDHVPPKMCNNLNDVELKELLPNENSSKVGTTSQGGAHFKTLCEECNSTRLGTRYDPALIDLSNEITGLVLGAKNKVISLPEKIYPFIRPQKLARSIIGHCLAENSIQETNALPLSSPINDAMREYFLNENSEFPKRLEIYYWLYPSRRQVVIKYLAKGYFGRKEPIIGHVLNFLPLGFWLIWDRPASTVINASRLVVEDGAGINEISQIELPLYRIPSLNFPEAPEGDEMILVSNEHAVVGLPKY